MDQYEKAARAELALKYQLSPLKALKVIEKLGSARAFSTLALIQQQQMIPGISINKNFSLTDLEQCKYVVYGEEDYPYLLSQIPDPPLVLFYRGDLGQIDLARSVSIVGTRKPTGYGKQITERITAELVQAGLATVSGLAYGIDALVHKVTMMNEGKTVAVLGTGVNTPYPAAHKYLYDQINVNGGLIISENYLDAPYSRWVFPRRNRIIAGLTPLTLVIEAAEHSGALLTANFAFQYDREVLAVPGPITSEQSRGAHDLIRSDKARLFSESSDIFQNFGITKPDLIHKKLEGLSVEQRQLINLVRDGTVEVDLLADSMNIKINELNRLLGILELSKILTRNGSGVISLQIESE